MDKIQSGMKQKPFQIQQHSTVYVKLSAKDKPDSTGNPVSLQGQSVEVKVIKVNRITQAKTVLLSEVVGSFTAPYDGFVFSLTHTESGDLRRLRNGYIEFAIRTQDGGRHVFERKLLIDDCLKTSFDGVLAAQGWEDNLFLHLEDNIRLPFSNPPDSGVGAMGIGINFKVY